MRPGRDRIDGLAPAVGGEVGAGDLEHARVVRLRVERGDGIGPVLRDVLVARQVLGVEVTGPQRGQVHDREHDHQTGRRQGEHRTPAPLRPAVGPASRDRVHAGGEQHREPERDQRHRAARAAQREPEARRLRERLEQAAERDWGRRTGWRRPRPRRRPPRAARSRRGGASAPPSPTPGRGSGAGSSRRSARGSACTGRCRRSSDRCGRCRRRTSSRVRAAPRSASDDSDTTCSVSVYFRTSSP